VRVDDRGCPELGGLDGLLEWGSCPIDWNVYSDALADDTEACNMMYPCYNEGKLKDKNGISQSLVEEYGTTYKGIINHDSPFSWGHPELRPNNNEFGKWPDGLLTLKEKGFLNARDQFSAISTSFQVLRFGNPFDSKTGTQPLTIRNISFTLLGAYAPECKEACNTSNFKAVILSLVDPGNKVRALVIDTGGGITADAGGGIRMICPTVSCSFEEVGESKNTATGCYDAYGLREDGTRVPASTIKKNEGVEGEGDSTDYYFGSPFDTGTYDTRTDTSIEGVNVATSRELEEYDLYGSPYRLSMSTAVNSFHYQDPFTGVVVRRGMSLVLTIFGDVAAHGYSADVDVCSREVCDDPGPMNGPFPFQSCRDQGMIWPKTSECR